MTMRLFEDDWQGVRSRDTEYQCESPEQIHEALGKLNGKNKTIVAVIAANDHHLPVGGGTDGKYGCYVTSGSQILNLKNPTIGKGMQIVRLVAGGQAGELAADLCVDLGQVTLAANHYWERVEPNPALVWEPAR